MELDIARVFEIAVTGMGLLYLWWEFHANSKMWVMGIIMPAIDIYLYWTKGVYGNMLMSGYYLLVAVYGMAVWKFGFRKEDRSRGEQPITNVTPGYMALFAVAVAAVWGVTYYMLVTYTPSTVPALDAATNALSIVGMWALARKFLQQWVFWIVYDLLTVYLDWTKDLPFKAGIHLVYAAVAVLGYMKWRRMMREARKLAVLLLVSLFSFSAMGQRFTDYVDPLIGSGDHGHVFVGANVPFGMVQAGPTEYQHQWDWCSGYHYSSDSIIGFSHMHLSGTGCGDLGDIALMPVMGEAKCSRKGLAQRFSHENETARAGYYCVRLDNGILCEMTASQRVAMHRYTFPQGGRSLVIDLENSVSTWDKTGLCRFQQLNDSVIIGFRHSTGWARDQRLFYAISFSRPIQSIEYRNGVRPNSKGSQYAVVRWEDRDEPLLVKVALSPTSEASALANMRLEMPGWDFAAVRDEADEAWNRELGRIRAVLPTEREMRIFYTSMFHLMVAPQLWCDATNDYMGADGRVHYEADYQHLTTWSLWDTYRSVHPLSTLIFPDRSRDYARTMLDICRQSGEIPVWHLVSNETYCMVGEPAVPVLADIILKGQNGDAPAEELYQAMRLSLLPDSLCGYDMRGKDAMRRFGYIPYDCGQNESVAKSMEYFLAFWSAARIAGLCGHRADSILLHDISMNYKRLYDRKTGFMRALDSKGSFRDAKGFNPCHQTQDYTEGNAWHYTFLVPHDVMGLVELVGGPGAFEGKLDSLFTADSDLGENAAPDISGLIGQYAHGNEPSHHVLYLYNYVGRNDKTCMMVRRVMDELYDDKPAGLCGNEDVGQMSAWYILSALGIYQVEPCGGVYQLGCPAVREAEVSVGEGRTLRITTKGNPSRAKVRGWRWNGKALGRTYITHEEIAKGGHLECVY